jgi:predicted dehydrogenase
MRFFIAGLGSMGKRRIRCLNRLGYSDIIAYDLDQDRRHEAGEQYDIETVENIDSIPFAEIDSIIVSTPPHAHNQYIELAIEHETPAFVEASAISEGLPELSRAATEAGVIIAPSCTMRFHPAIRDIKQIVQSGEYGSITNFSYHFGQYLPDWHPWEDVQDFYVSRDDSAATREMVPFELMWIVDIVGFPEDVTGHSGKTMDIGADIDDTYAITLDFGDSLGTLLVDVVARYATRRLVLNLESAQILWSWDEDVVRVYEAENDRWIEYHQPEGETHQDYNENIIEDMYDDELETFINAVTDDQTFPHSLDEDIKILETLNTIEDNE